MCYTPERETVRGKEAKRFFFQKVSVEVKGTNYLRTNPINYLSLYSAWNINGQYIGHSLKTHAVYNERTKMENSSKLSAQLPRSAEMLYDGLKTYCKTQQ